MTEIFCSPITTAPLNSKEKKNYTSLIVVAIFISLVLLPFILWLTYQNAFGKLFKSITAGSLLVYYSWELIYFDSLRPGIQPSSPLSPPSIRMTSGHTLHLNYAMALFIGVFVTLFVGIYL